jgi:hypothetical protein
VTDATRPYPVRDPAPGPCVILDLPRLWAAVEAEMLRRGMTRKNGTPELKQLADLVGLDRNTLGRVRAAARNNKIVEGQRGGLNVNAYLTLTSFVNNGRAAAYGRELRGGVPPHTAALADPASDPFDSAKGGVSDADEFARVARDNEDVAIPMAATTVDLPTQSQAAIARARADAARDTE